MAINKLCGSGLKAVHLAAQAIQTGEAEIVVAGSLEQLEPSTIFTAKGPYRLQDG